MLQGTLEDVLQELFPGHKVKRFQVDFILDCPRADEESVRKVYQLLRRYGLSDKKIASRVHLLGLNPESIESNYRALQRLGLNERKIATLASLLGRDPETIESNHRALRELGLSDEKIASRVELLGSNPKTIESNYRALRELGLSDGKIASRANLLGSNPKTIERNHRALQRLGLSEGRIATHAHLLGMNPKTIERNYQHHIRLLGDYRDRPARKHLLTSKAQLLGVSPETVAANIQYLHSHGIDHQRGMLLGTKVRTKRKKLAWMLRELFDYRSVPTDQRRNVINNMYNFVRDNPKLLILSVNTLEQRKEKLRDKIAA